MKPHIIRRAIQTHINCSEKKKIEQFTFLAIWQKTFSMIKCSLISMITFVQAFQLVE
jgi:hypothetical protein